MLAFVGMIFTDFYTLPGYEFSTLDAHDAGVANGSMSQLLLWLGLLELFSFIGVDQMLRGSGREPGDYGATRHAMQPMRLPLTPTSGRRHRCRPRLLARFALLWA